jgi:hypothetical protein
LILRLFYAKSNNPLLLVKIPGMISEKLMNKPKLCQFSQNSLKNCPKESAGGDPSTFSPEQINYGQNPCL